MGSQNAFLRLGLRNQGKMMVATPIQATEQDFPTPLKGVGS